MNSSAPIEPVRLVEEDGLKKIASVEKTKQKLTLRDLQKKKKLSASESNSLNNIYRKVWYNYFNGDKQKITLHTVWILCYSEIPMWFFTLLDVLKLKSLFKYRLHYKHQHVEHLGIRNYPPLELVLKTMKVSQFNFLFAYFIPSYVLMKLGFKLGIYVYDTEADEKKLTWKRLFKEVVMISVIADLFFYWLHKLLHTPKFYLRFHKMHHDFKYSIAMAHHWMDFVEALMFYLPQVLPPLLIWGATGKRCHVLSLWTGMMFTQISGIFGHAGYRLPFIPKWLPFFQPHYHDYHHVDYSANFGAIFPAVDMLFGTHINASLETNVNKVLTMFKK